MDGVDLAVVSGEGCGDKLRLGGFRRGCPRPGRAIRSQPDVHPSFRIAGGDPLGVRAQRQGRQFTGRVELANRLVGRGVKQPNGLVGAGSGCQLGIRRDGDSGDRLGVPLKRLFWRCGETPKFQTAIGARSGQ